MRKQFAWIAVLCLAVSFAVSGAESDETDPIPPKELRALLKEDASTAVPAGELIFGMSAEEKQKLRELFRSDRAAARKYLLDELAARQSRRKEELKTIRDLARQCRDSKDEAEKERLRAQLRPLLAEQFNRTSAEIALRIRMQEQRLAEVRRAYEERQAGSERLIDETLEKLVRKRPAPAKKKAEKEKEKEKETGKQEVQAQ